MREQFGNTPNVEKIKSQELIHVANSNEKVNELMVEALKERHGRKIFHDPQHTLGDGETLDLTSVRGGIVHLSAFLKESFPQSLRGKEGTLALMEKAMEAGVIAHDVVIEIDGVNKDGMIQRRRGWKDGGNERESFKLLRKEFLQAYAGDGLDKFTPQEEEMLHSILTDENAPEFDAAYTQYMESAERVVGGTEPDAMNFWYPVDYETYLSDYPSEVLDCLKAIKWTEENPEFNCFSIDSTKTQTSLEGLLGSTADLGAVSNPEFFAQSGNAEFWELQYAMAKDCAAFLKNNDALSDSRVAIITHAMRGWRRTQVGVAVGQKVRLEEKYTPENISQLFGINFGTVPYEGEVETFIGNIKESFSEIDRSVTLCADIYTEFSERFEPLLNLEPGPLSDENKALFVEAIQYMNADETLLANYVAHVDEELEKLKENGV